MRLGRCHDLGSVKIAKLNNILCLTQQRSLQSLLGLLLGQVLGHQNHKTSQAEHDQAHQGAHQRRAPANVARGGDRRRGVGVGWGRWRRQIHGGRSRHPDKGVCGWRHGQANNHARPHLCDGRVAIKPMNKPALHAAQQPHPHTAEC